MNQALAEVLIVNLISNSVKHNIQNGNINITLDNKHLSISNNGPLHSMLILKLCSTDLKKAHPTQNHWDLAFQS